MTVVVATERLFSLSCFEGLRLLRKYMENFPEQPLSRLLTLIESVEADAHSLDMEASVHLSALIEPDCPLDGRTFYQSCIKAILIKHQPIWARSMKQGRRRFVNSLNVDERDVFAAAGLLEVLAADEVVAWWDEVAGLGRLVSDQVKINQGRIAERLTIEQERTRLKKIGIEKEPEWPGLDDNFAGYDVLSYDYDSTEVVNQLIEVKSTVMSPMRFYVTRNEWRIAERTQKRYLFHVWDMSKNPPVLHKLDVATVAPHVPIDNEKGEWQNVLIPVSIR